MQNWRKSLSLLVAGLATLSTVLLSPAAEAASGPFQVQNFGSRMCATVEGNLVVQRPCDRSNTAQQWIFDPLGGTDYHLINVATSLCMRVFRTNADSVPITVIDCTTISDEKFGISGPIPTAVPHQIIARIGGGNRCVDIRGGSLDSGAQWQIFHCTSENPAQLFNIGLF